MSLEERFKYIEMEDELRALRLQNAQLRQVISCAMCAHCGEEIADKPWTVTDEGKLVCEECDEGDEDGAVADAGLHEGPENSGSGVATETGSDNKRIAPRGGGTGQDDPK